MLHRLPLNGRNQHAFHSSALASRTDHVFTVVVNSLIAVCSVVEPIEITRSPVPSSATSVGFP